jgi:putative ABC transport system substrate-binding protein
LELLHELLPTQQIVGLLINPTNPLSGPVVAGVQTAASSLGLQLHVLHARTDEEIDGVFSSLSGLKVGALVIGTDPFFTSRAEKLGALSLRFKMPAIYQYRTFTAAGGIMSYGGSITDSYYHAGLYAGRILKGEKPADLPVQLTTKVELFLNLKSAEALAIKPPLSLLGRADEVIE